jgi:hypothetical protein
MQIGHAFRFGRQNTNFSDDSAGRTPGPPAKPAGEGPRTGEARQKQGSYPAIYAWKDVRIVRTSRRDRQYTGRASKLYMTRHGLAGGPQPCRSVYTTPAADRASPSTSTTV